MNRTLFRFNPWWEADVTSLRGLKYREKQQLKLNKQLNNKQIVFLTGLRRVGKTSLMKLCIDHLLTVEKIKPEKVLYVSLDDYRLKDSSVLDIVDSYREIHKLSYKEKVYLFLDEITQAKDYELQLKNLYDAGNTKIFASSSSASLLKKETGKLTGRHVTFEVLPLDFDEYLDFKELSIPPSDSHLLPSYFQDYLKTGGIPDYVLTEDDAYIGELVDDIIMKDIAAVHGIRNISLLKDFFLLIMERAGKTLSLNKAAGIVGISISTAQRFFELLCDTYLIYSVNRAGKLNEQMRSPKKIYACDTGIRCYFTGVRDWGSLFENYVFLRIKHLKPRFVKENNNEIDFLTENKTLIECKFHDKPLSKKQEELLQSYPAQKRFVVRSFDDLKQIT